MLRGSTTRNGYGDYKTITDHVICANPWCQVRSPVLWQDNYALQQMAFLLWCLFKWVSLQIVSVCLVITGIPIVLHLPQICVLFYQQSKHVQTYTNTSRYYIKPLETIFTSQTTPNNLWQDISNKSSHCTLLSALPTFTATHLCIRLPLIRLVWFSWS